MQVRIFFPSSSDSIFVRVSLRALSTGCAVRYVAGFSFVSTVLRSTSP